MLINVKVPTIVGISKCISMINGTSDELKKKRKVVIFNHVSFYEYM